VVFRGHYGIQTQGWSVRLSQHNAFHRVAAIAVLALGGCQDVERPLSPRPMLSRTTPVPAPLVPRIIAPQATDPAIDWVPAVNPQFNHHYVWLDPAHESNASCSCSCQAATASRGAINCWSKRRRA